MYRLLPYHDAINRLYVILNVLQPITYNDGLALFSIWGKCSNVLSLNTNIIEHMCYYFERIQMSHKNPRIMPNWIFFMSSSKYVLHKATPVE